MTENQIAESRQRLERFLLDLLEPDAASVVDDTGFPKQGEDLEWIGSKDFKRAPQQSETQKTA